MNFAVKLIVRVNVIKWESVVARLAPTDKISGGRAVLNLCTILGARRSARLTVLLPIRNIAEIMFRAWGTGRISEISYAVIHNSEAWGALLTVDAIGQGVGVLKH